MTIIERYNEIFEEASNDRSEALRVFRVVSDALRSVQLNQLVVPKADKPVTLVDLEELSGDPALNDVVLRFVADFGKNEKSGIGSFAQSGGKDIISLRVLVPSEKSKLKGDEWKIIVKRNAEKIFKRSMEVFIHEFTHLSDLRKMGKRGSDVLKKTKNVSSKSDSKYYNTSMEFNAYVQAGLAKIQDFVETKKNLSKEKLEKIIGKTPDEFLKLVLQVVEKNFADQLNDKNRKKIKKRTASMWKELMDSTGKEEAN